MLLWSRTRATSGRLNALRVKHVLYLVVKYHGNGGNWILASSERDAIASMFSKETSIPSRNIRSELAIRQTEPTKMAEESN